MFSLPRVETDAKTHDEHLILLFVSGCSKCIRSPRLAGQKQHCCFWYGAGGRTKVRIIILKQFWIYYNIYVIVITYKIFVGPRTHLRGQNVPLDSMVLMEREAKRAQALRVQAEVLKQLKEREDRKREELERKKIEERQRDKQLAEQRQR